MRKMILLALGLSVLAFMLINRSAASAASQEARVALETALLHEDLGAIQAAMTLARAELGNQAGIPEVPDEYRPVPPNTALPTADECRRAVKASAVKLKQLQFWKIGLDPTQMTAPLRAPASVMAYMLAIHREKLDEDGQALQNAKDAGHFLVWAQEQAQAGCYPFPAAKNTSKEQAMKVATRFLERAEAAGKLSQIVRNGWVYEDHGDGGMQFDNGVCGIAILELYEATQEHRYLESGLKSADWAITRPLCPNWNYNSFSVDLLAKAYQITQQPKYLEAAVKKATLGVIPGQLRDGPRAGRWMDPHNARPAYHYIMLAALARLAGELPADHPARARVLSSLKMGLLARNAEMVSLGVMSKDKPVECLSLVTRLFREDPVFLSETQSAAALDTLLRLAATEVRAGKFPLGPRAFGEILTLCCQRQ